MQHLQNEIKKFPKFNFDFSYCKLPEHWLNASLSLMGVGAQHDLGRHQTFPQKMTWCIKFCPKNQSVFPSKLRWSPKKKRKKKGLYWYWGVFFLSKLRWSLKKGISSLIVLFISFFSVAFQKKGNRRKRGVWEGMLNILRGKNCPKNMKLSKIFTQNRPKIWNCPKFRHLKPSGRGRGGSAPPAPHLLRNYHL